MRRVGLYIHIPFRIYKNNHRGTLSFCNMDAYIRSYFRFLKMELDLRKSDDILIDSIYFGGGDPTVMDSKYIVGILDHIKSNFRVEEDCEKTIEIDPLCPDFRIRDFADAGFNRFSIKVYTFDKKGLEYLDLNHDRFHVRDVVKLAESLGINNINLDMYFAYPGQTIDSLIEDFVLIEKLNVPHLSFYSFMDKEDIDAHYHSKEKIEAFNDLESRMLDEISSQMEYQGYKHYEINHFSRKNFECYHNKKYWNLEEYIGAGLGASGYIDNILYKNQVDFNLYFSDIKDGKFPYLEKEFLSEGEKEKNYIILKMGTVEGVNIEKINFMYNIDFLSKYKDVLAKHENNGIIEIKDANVRFTNKGIYLSNQFFIDII